MLRKTLVTLLALATLPLASSAGSFAHDDAIEVLVAAPAWAPSHIYALSTSAGDAVTVTIEWASSSADLDLRILAPTAPSCALLPEPDLPCVASNAGGRDAACQNGRSPTQLGPASESVSFVAVDGVYEVVVMAALATPGSVGYHVEIAVDGAGGAVSGPEAATFLGTNPACKL